MNTVKEITTEIVSFYTSPLLIFTNVSIMSAVLQKLRKLNSIPVLRSHLQCKLLSTSPEITVDLGANVFATHNFEAPATTVTTTKDELMGFFKQMYIMRRVEITNDTEYKVSFWLYFLNFTSTVIFKPIFDHFK